MGILLNAVQSRIKIELLNVTTEVRPERIHHLYICERQGCEFEFSVTQTLEDQDSICCPKCLTDDCVRDIGDVVLMRGELENEF